MDSVIADEDFIRGSVRIKDMADELGDILKEASEIVKAIVETQNVKKSRCEELEELCEKISSFSKAVKCVGSDIMEETAEFISDLDKADLYLYEGKE